jgi:uncharacterized protein YihD (DUF1040 family)
LVEISIVQPCSMESASVWELLHAHHQGNLSYKDSVALFFTLFPEKTGLKSFFATKDRFSEKKLNTELANKYQELEKNQEANNFVNYTKSKFPAIDLTKLPPELRQERENLKVVFRELTWSHARLVACTDDKKRYELAKRIVELVAQRQEIFNKTDEYLATGKFTKPIEHETIKLVPGIQRDYEVENKLRLLRTQRSKLKNKPNKVHQLNEVIKQIQELETKRYA